jgi:hypothetical protein
MCELFWGKVCYLWGREAAVYFTGQERVKNKTAANPTPHVLQGLSMTPSFPLSPKPGSTSPEGLPTPGAVAFGFYANNCLPWAGNDPQPELLPGHSMPLHHPSSHSWSSLAFLVSPPYFLRWRFYGMGTREGSLVLFLPALGWQLPAGGSLGLHSLCE